jgi:hypothetical protein
MKTREVLHMEQSSGAETWAVWKVDSNTWKVFRCGAGKGWRRLAGPIV